ncbi:hypothetical protein ACWD8L_14285, partial [Streptomyces sp. NPDC005133]
DIESKGGATVYRFTPGSVRRALDAGCDAAVGVGFSGRREVGSTGGHWTDRQPERYPAHMKIRKKDITSRANLSAIEQERKPSWPALYGPPEPSANSPANSLAT